MYIVITLSETILGGLKNKLDNILFQSCSLMGSKTAILSFSCRSRSEYVSGVKAKQLKRRHSRLCLCHLRHTPSSSVGKQASVSERESTKKKKRKVNPICHNNDTLSQKQSHLTQQPFTIMSRTSQGMFTLHFYKAPGFPPYPGFSFIEFNSQFPALR